MEGIFYNLTFNSSPSIEDELILKLDCLLPTGNIIDFTLGEERKTILHESIQQAYPKLVKYALNAGARIEREFISHSILQPHEQYNTFGIRPWNAHEYAIVLYAAESNKYREIYNILNDECLKNYYSYGLRPIHILCATGNWNPLEKDLKNFSNNNFIDNKSPIWPGMSPILIAAKFNHQNIVNKLIEFGVSMTARDSGGNTILHYLSSYGKYDRRFFIYDKHDTYGDFTGMSHFQIACLFCPDTLDIVQKYLDQGFSPDMKVINSKYYTWRLIPKYQTGLHIGANVNSSSDKILCCPKLAELLLKYGANVNQMDASYHTPLQYCTSTHFYLHGLVDYAQYIVTLLEAGANYDYRCINTFVHLIGNNLHHKLSILKCIRRMMTLDLRYISQDLLYYYEKLLDECIENFDEESYTNDCLLELENLTEIGYFSVASSRGIQNREFKYKYGFLPNCSSLSEVYPIFGHILEIKFHKQLRQERKKKKCEKVALAVPFLIFVARQFCNLPSECAELILHNLNMNDLDKFLSST